MNAVCPDACSIRSDSKDEYEYEYDVLPRTVSVFRRPALAGSEKQPRESHETATRPPPPLRYVLTLPKYKPEFYQVASSKDCCVLEARYVSLSLYQLSTIP